MEKSKTKDNKWWYSKWAMQVHMYQKEWVSSFICVFFYSLVLI